MQHSLQPDKINHVERERPTIGPQSMEPQTAEHVLPAPVEMSLPTEIGGRDGPEPTRFGDWEKAGRCIDF